MATLILTAVGTAVAGPIGGMIGSVVGQYFDQNVLFAPKPRHGPRLGELSVQTSTYGAAIPKVFGRMRVAGCVIWSTDLIESRSTSGGGKGQPKLVSYSYSASFAVLLSGRPIGSVGRIWADGKLLRGAAGDFKTPTGYRLYLGDEDQAPDPLIVSAEDGQAPAYRGLAYAVFENFQLADYGNRIPSLTFEVEADAPPLGIGAIAEALSGGEIAAGVTPALTGYAASGDSVRGALEALAETASLSLSDRDGRLRLSIPAGEAQPVAAAAECRRRELVQRAQVSVPDEVTIAHYDPARDFQTGIQRASAEGSGGGRGAERRALAAALDADAARGLAEHRLTTLRAARASAKLAIGRSAADLRPGDAIALEGERGRWRIQQWTLASTGLDLALVRLPPGGLPASVAATPGRPLLEADRLHGPTLLRLVELPLGGGAEGRPLLFAAAAGEEEGWRRAALLASFDGGATWDEISATAAPAVMGTTTTVLAPGPSTLIDTRSTVEVELVHAGMWLDDAEDDALDRGANLALLGDELVQFARADHLGGRHFGLSRLWRGRRGSEWAAGSHAEGEGFLLLDKETLLVLEAPAGAVGAEARLSAAGVGDTAGPATAARPIRGECFRPPPPAHLRTERFPGGDLRFGWVRRSRSGWTWQSGSETPLGEEREAYRLTIRGGGFERSATVTEPGFLYSAADQASDGAAGLLTVAVVQLGTFAASRPASLIFTLS